MTHGGKADNLLKLIGNFQIPEFFVISPDESLDDVQHRFDELGAEKVAVRSSAVNEDGKDAAWAGQLESILNVGRDDLAAAIERCRRSSDSARVRAYAAAHQLESGDVAVIVQRMLQSRTSGVAFSRHPVTGESKVVVEAVRGLGEQLVSGEVTPDTYIEGGEQHLSDNNPILTTNELGEVTDLTKRVESFFGHPIDIEWAYAGEKLYLLQARPITTV